MFTLACPFVNKGIDVHKLWIDNFKRVRLPRSEMKLLFVDMCKNEEITLLYKNYLKEHENEWLKVEYLKDPKKEFKIIPTAPMIKSGDSFFEKRKSVAETMQIVNEHREGDMVLWEDDIIVPDNAFEYMVKVWEDKDTYSVGGTQYTRTDWNGGKMLLCWKFDNNWKPIAQKYSDEKETGIEQIGATATGFQIYKAEFLDNYNFKCEYSSGQDVITGMNINKLGKKIVICWEMKFPHLGENLGKLKIYKSDKCKTPVYNKYNIDLSKNDIYSVEEIITIQLDRKTSPLFVRIPKTMTDEQIFDKYKFNKLN